MHRSATDMSLEMTHSRSRPDFRMALELAMAESCTMRLRSDGSSFSHLMAVEGLILMPAVTIDSSTDIPMARALQ